MTNTSGKDPRNQRRKPKKNAIIKKQNKRAIQPARGKYARTSLGGESHGEGERAASPRALHAKHILRQRVVHAGEGVEAATTAATTAAAPDMLQNAQRGLRRWLGVIGAVTALNETAARRRCRCRLGRRWPIDEAHGSNGQWRLHQIVQGGR